MTLSYTTETIRPGFTAPVDRKAALAVTAGFAALACEKLAVASDGVRKEQAVKELRSHIVAFVATLRTEAHDTKSPLVWAAAAALRKNGLTEPEKQKLTFDFATSMEAASKPKASEDELASLGRTTRQIVAHMTAGYR